MGDKSFHDYVLSDLFSEFRGITSKSMFGGYGFYKDGKIFGMIAGGRLYFKVGDTNRRDYEKYGSKPFNYTGHKGKTYEMSYWEVPEDIFENREELEIWVGKAVNESMRKKK